MEQLLQRNRSLWALFDAIVTLQDRDECARFFRDLCTLKELEAMAERWEVAQMIQEGCPYRQIREATGASTTTITRIAHWLRHGEGGYRLVLDRSRKLGSSGQSSPTADRRVRRTVSPASRGRRGRREEK